MTKYSTRSIYFIYLLIKINAMTKKLLLLALLNGFAMFSQLVFNEDFSTYTTGQPLSGQGTWTNNSSLNGGLGSCTGIGCVSSTITNYNLSYQNYGSAAKALSISSNQDAVGTIFTGVTSGSLYLSFVVNLSSTISDPSNSLSHDFFRVMSSGNYNTTFRMGAYNSGSGFVVFIQKGAGAKVYSNVLPFNQNQLLVMKFVINPGTNDDSLSLFVNPDVSLAEPSTTIQTIDGGLGTTDYTGAIDRMNFRSNYSTIPTGYIGMVKVSKSWGSLSLNTPNLQNNSSFIINGKEAKNGNLSIKSNRNIASALLNIYAIQGNKIDSKNISLVDSLNEVSILNLNVSGTYIIELIENSGAKFVQKIIVN